MTHDNKLVVVFLFLYWEGKTPSQAKIEKLRGDITIAVQNVIGGSVERVEDAMYADIAKVFENQMLAVKEILRREDVFSGTTIEEDVATFYNLGISSLYFGQNNPAQIAKHLTSFIGAKRAATVSGSNPSPGSRIDYGVMSFHHVEGREGVFFCLDADKEKAGLVQKINEYKGECPAELTTAVTMFRSKQPLIHGKCLVMALAVQSRFLRAAPASGVPDIWEVSSASFLRTKSRKSRAKYEEMLQAASGMLHPISDVQKRTRHPGHVVMFVYPQGAPEGGIQFLNDITALLKLQISQLFAETFSNGMVTYNVYVEAAKGHEVADEADMARKILSLQRRMTTLAVLPRAALANNTDAFDPRAKLYLGCAQVFASHFIDNGRVVRAEQLLKANAAQNRLDRMGKVMLQDTVTCSRFNQTMQTHPELALAVYDDFVRTRTPDDGPPAQRTLPPLNEELRRRVKEHVTGVDQEIFNACLLFNSAIYKTNFFAREKAATSFRLCPSLFISSEVYPEVPHAIFLIVGASFEGFHVRFRDIARGGIRAIASAGETHGKKQQALFEETYNLAYTQQLNVPEGGSKGTILLNPDACAQASASAAYKAYTDALLDLLLPDAQVPDLLGDDEILFFSADEATPPATVAWAEHHARKRGYPFWKTVACEECAQQGADAAPASLRSASWTPPVLRALLDLHGAGDDLGPPDLCDPCDDVDDGASTSASSVFLSNSSTCAAGDVVRRTPSSETATTVSSRHSTCTTRCRLSRFSESGGEALRCVKFVNGKASELGLPVVCLSTDFNPQRKTLTVHCVSSVDRPDFRPLLKLLYDQYRCRIWFDTRQRGPASPADAAAKTDAKAAAAAAAAAALAPPTHATAGAALDAAALNTTVLNTATLNSLNEAAAAVLNTAALNTAALSTAALNTAALNTAVLNSAVLRASPLPALDMLYNPATDPFYPSPHAVAGVYAIPAWPGL